MVVDGLTDQTVEFLRPAIAERTVSCKHGGIGAIRQGLRVVSGIGE